MPKLIVDFMGGDRAPLAIIDGISRVLGELNYLEETKGELVLVGDQHRLQATLKKRRFSELRKAIANGKTKKGCIIRVVHAEENIEMNESVKAVRTKPNATIYIGCQLTAEGYKSKDPVAFLSAGHSGAMMVSSMLHISRTKNIERPAIAVKLPTLSQNGCVLIDAGANVDCQPNHLRDFAIMGGIFAQIEKKDSSPVRVGILSNGEEKSKGNDLTRKAYELVENSIENLGGFQFLGYVEGKDIFKGQVDVVVCDGFVGNVLLKSLEGLGSTVIALLKQQSKRNWMGSIGLALSAGILRRLKRKLDYAEYGAAPLLGVNGYVFIGHGRSDGRAIKNAVLRTQTALKSRFVEKLEEALT
jgi:glycerol-3-phosphate acyltransferase PlsX